MTPSLSSDIQKLAGRQGQVHIERVLDAAAYGPKAAERRHSAPGESDSRSDGPVLGISFVRSLESQPGKLREDEELHSEKFSLGATR
jgi:hypothetical protein